MSYRTAFQCPITGETIIAHYAFGRVTMHSADDAQDPATEDYCAQHSGRRCGSLAAADHFIVQVSEGQTDGFEERP
jgi:hypothetical protein